jgi:hypothetical protein
MAPAVQKLVPLDARAEWERELEGVPHAFAHTWGSCRAMQLTTGWPTFLYVWRDGASRAVCAVAERGEPGQVDVVTPYGFGGFAGVDVRPGLLDDWHGFARDRGYVAGYLGLNPVLAPAVFRQSPDYAEHNDVYVLELDRGLDALHAALSRNRRRQLAAFAAGGARIVRERQRVAAYFLANVDAFLQSSGASAAYALSPSTWRSLLDLDESLLIGAEGADGELVAACLFTSTRWCAEAMFSISSPAGRMYSAPLIWAGARELAARGIPCLNLGGGVRRGDGVAQFKERFSPRRLALGALRQVYRPAIYAELCREVGAADPADRSGYFPPYRRPVAQATPGPRQS